MLFPAEEFNHHSLWIVTLYPDIHGISQRFRRELRFAIVVKIVAAIFAVVVFVKFSLERCDVAPAFSKVASKKKSN